MSRFTAIPVALATVSVLALSAGIAKAEPPAAAADDVAVKAALLRSLVVNDLRAPAATGGAATAPSVATHAGTVEPGRQNRLADIRSTEGAGATNAGAAREVAVAAGTSTVERPAAGIRVIRRMNVERTLAAAAPAVQGCADRASLRTGARLTFKIAVLPTGEVERVTPLATAGIGRDTVACVAAALMSVTFTGPGGTGASLEVPVTMAAGKAGTASPSPPSSPLSPPSAPIAMAKAASGASTGPVP